MTLTSYISMNIIPAKSCKVITCTIQRVLPELDYVTGFNDLVKKIIEAKVEEKCIKKVIFFDFEVNFLPN